MSNQGKDNFVLHGLDLMDIVSYVDTKNKRYLAMVLQDVEDVLGKGHPDFPVIRKSVLDGFNSYTRSLIRALFGEIEDSDHA